MHLLTMVVVVQNNRMNLSTHLLFFQNSHPSFIIYLIFQLHFYSLIKYSLMESHLHGKEFISAHNSRLQSIPVGELQQQELETLVHIISIVKSRERMSACMLEVHLASSTYTAQDLRPEISVLSFRLNLPTSVKQP